MPLVPYDHLGDLQGVDNPGGLAVDIFFAPLRAFLDLQGIKTGVGVVTLADTVSIDGSHTFDTGDGFFKLYGTLETGQVKYAQIGERDGRSLKVEGSLFHPGNSATAAGLLGQIKNERAIVIVKYADGTMEQIGNADLPCEISYEFETGTAGGGRRGYMVKFEAFQQRKQYYTGTITEAV